MGAGGVDEVDGRRDRLAQRAGGARSEQRVDDDRAPRRSARAGAAGARASGPRTARASPPRPSPGAPSSCGLRRGRRAGGIGDEDGQTRPGRRPPAGARSRTRRRRCCPARTAPPPAADGPAGRPGRRTRSARRPSSACDDLGDRGAGGLHQRVLGQAQLCAASSMRAISSAPMRTGTPRSARAAGSVTRLGQGHSGRRRSSRSAPGVNWSPKAGMPPRSMPSVSGVVPSIQSWPNRPGAPPRGPGGSRSGPSPRRAGSGSRPDPARSGPWHDAHGGWACAISCLADGRIGPATARGHRGAGARDGERRVLADQVRGKVDAADQEDEAR